MAPKEEQIKYNIEDLNIDLIHNVLKHLKVKWKDSKSGEKRIPNEKEIEVVAEYCMREAFKSKDKIFSIGWFEAEVIDGIVGIKFVLTQANPLSKILS